MHRNISNIVQMKNVGLPPITTLKTTSTNIGTVDQLPKQFVAAMRTLFDIMDDKRTGFVNLGDIEHRWQDDGSKGMPKGVIDCLRKVTPISGMLSFERFCAGLKICLLKNQTEPSMKFNVTANRGSSGDNREGKQHRPPSAPLLDLENPIPNQQWNTNNTAAVRPNNASIPIQRTLSLTKLSPTDSEIDSISQEAHIVPSLYAPPKPPRSSLLFTSANNPERIDKAEIRHALQNWQMGILMNEMDSNDKRRINGQPNWGPTDAGGKETIVNGHYQKKNNTRRREPRRHTLQNGIDYNMLKKLKQFEQEKDVLLEGLTSVEKAHEWYLKQIAVVEDKIKQLGRIGSYVEQWSEAHQERLDLQRARVIEVNRHLLALTESWERAAFPLHMNLAVRAPQNVNSMLPLNSEMINRLKLHNRQLTDEVNQKNERIGALECERQSLIREMVQIQRHKKHFNEEAIF